MTRLVLMGVDPGTKNMAISVTYYEKKLYRVKTARMFTKPIVLMDATVEEKTVIFIKDIRRLLLKYKPQVVGIELFMARSFRSNLGIPIMYMVGIVAMLCIDLGIKINPVMPSTWKRSLKKDIIDIKQLYDRSYPTKRRLPDHIIDSIFIGIFSHKGSFQGLSHDHIKELIECQRKIFISALPTIVKEKKRQKK